MRLIILGMGGYGRTIADVAEQTGMYEEIIFLDDQADQAMDTCASYWKITPWSFKKASKGFTKDSY